MGSASFQPLTLSDGNLQAAGPAVCLLGMTYQVVLNKCAQHCISVGRNGERLFIPGHLSRTCWEV